MIKLQLEKQNFSLMKTTKSLRLEGVGSNFPIYWDRDRLQVYMS